MTVKKLTYLLFLMAVSHQALAQDKDARVYLAVDKPYHAAGEFLAYSLYNLEANSYFLTAQPTVAYIDLIHPYGATVLTQAMRVTNGRASGVFALPDTLSGGIYKLSATLSGDNRQTFTREVMIDGASKLNLLTKANMKMILSPEGGRLINGISGWVGVRLTDNFGFPTGITTEGVVKKVNGEVVTRFKINEHGYGRFQILPDAQKYSVEVTMYGQVISQALPVAQDGLAISTYKSNADTIRITIKSSPAWYGKNFSLRLSARGKVNVKTEGQVKSAAGYRIKIPASTVWQGVNELYVGVEADSMYGKRAVYVPAGQRVKAEIQVSKTSFNPREAGTVQVSIKDQYDKPLPASFTATLYEHRYAPGYVNFEEAIISKSRYSSSGTDAQQELFDDEMLNFYAAAPIVQSARPERKGFINVLEGQAINPQTKNPLADTVVIVSLVSPLHPHPILLFERTDANGNFKVVMPPVNGNLTVFVKIKDIPESSSVQFIIKNQSEETKNSQQAGKKSNVRVDLGNASGYYKIFNENKSISEAYNTRPVEILENEDDAFTSYAFNRLTTLYTMSDYLVPATLKEVIVDIMNGVTVRKRKGKDELRVMQREEFSKRFKPPFRAQPLMLVDGVPVIDQALVFAIPASEILTIEMCHDSLFYKDVYLNGVFSISTRNKQFLYRDDLNQYSYATTALQSPVAFKFPTRNAKQVSESEAPDFRSLLFYQPLGETNEAGESQLSFTTSDDQGKFILSIEGITDSGIPFYRTVPIEVRKK